MGDASHGSTLLGGQRSEHPVHGDGVEILVEDHIGNAPAVVSGKIEDDEVRLAHERSGKARIVQIPNRKPNFLDKVVPAQQHLRHEPVTPGSGLGDLLKRGDDGSGGVGYQSQLRDLSVVEFPRHLGGGTHIVGAAELEEDRRLPADGW